MSEIPADLKYTKEHEWLKPQGDGTALTGITDYAQQRLGDITFVELPGSGDEFKQGDVFGVAESVKAASDLYMPVSGEILEANAGLEDNPEKVNESPYGEGWLVKIKMSAPEEAGTLLDAAAYKKLL